MMKMNKWTMALAAAGVVSLSSVAQAQEAAAGAEALAASTTLSGYISTSYTAVSDDGHSETFRNATNNGFALDVVSLSISNGELGTEEGSAAYNLELWIGPAASDIDTNDAASSGENSLALMEANIELLASLGEQDVKLTVGQFATTVGAETYSYGAGDNDFHSRSFAFNIQPTHHTGVKADLNLSGTDITVGIVNDSAGSNTNADMGSNAVITGLSHTLGDSVGWLGGTQLSYGGVHEAGTDNADATNYYFGITKDITTDLTYSIAWDIRESGTAGEADSNVLGHYLSYPVGGGTLNLRVETGNLNEINGDGSTDINGLESVSIGYNYPIWTGVTSRVEYVQSDWDGKDDGSGDSFAVNLVYSF
jgi:hypothetical protein